MKPQSIKLYLPYFRQSHWIKQIMLNQMCLSIRYFQLFSLIFTRFIVSLSLAVHDSTIQALLLTLQDPENKAYSYQSNAKASSSD